MTDDPDLVKGQFYSVVDADNAFYNRGVIYIKDIDEADCTYHVIHYEDDGSIIKDEWVEWAELDQDFEQGWIVHCDFDPKQPISSIKNETEKVAPPKPVCKDCGRKDFAFQHPGYFICVFCYKHYTPNELPGLPTNLTGSST